MIMNQIETNCFSPSGRLLLSAGREDLRNAKASGGIATGAASTDADDAGRMRL